jgi:serine/threonine protein kinase
VFEYVANGNLFDQLHKSDLPQVTSSNRINCWKVRLQVAWEIAEALLYLHTFASPPIFHRDVKTSNILLDEDFHAKLADFGISRSVPNQATHISTNPQGTPGYVDPEYHNCYRLTDKSDVYSFGVVLMELLSGRQAVDMFAKSKDEINLSTLTLSKVADGTWHELLDQSCWASSYNHHPGDSSEPARIQYFSGTPHHRECITLNLDHCKNPIAQSLVELAVRCLQPASANRPHMKDVVLALSGLCKQCHLN